MINDMILITILALLACLKTRYRSVESLQSGKGIIIS